MSLKPSTPASNLPEVTTGNHAAQAVLDTLAAEQPAEIWQHLADAIADTPALVAQIIRLRATVAEERLDRANMAAAALAAIGAHQDREPDPLSYLRDELTAQGHDLATGVRT